MNAIGIVSCVGFVLLLIGTRLAERWRDGRRSGWAALGRRYPAERRGRRPIAWGEAVCLNGRWHRDIDVHIADGGIRLRLPAVFRPYHRPLLLPWDDLTADPMTLEGDLPLSVGDGAKITLAGPIAARAARVLARRHSNNISST